MTDRAAIGWSIFWIVAILIYLSGYPDWLALIGAAPLGMAAYSWEKHRHGRQRSR